MSNKHRALELLERQIGRSTGTSKEAGERGAPNGEHATDTDLEEQSQATPPENREESPEVDDLEEAGVQDGREVGDNDDHLPNQVPEEEQNKGEQDGETKLPDESSDHPTNQDLQEESKAAQLIARFNESKKASDESLVALLGALGEDEEDDEKTSSDSEESAKEETEEVDGIDEKQAGREACAQAAEDLAKMSREQKAAACAQFIEKQGGMGAMLGGGLADAMDQQMAPAPPAQEETVGVEEFLAILDSLIQGEAPSGPDEQKALEWLAGHGLASGAPDEGAAEESPESPESPENPVEGDGSGILENEDEEEVETSPAEATGGKNAGLRNAILSGTVDPNRLDNLLRSISQGD